MIKNLVPFILALLLLMILSCGYYGTSSRTAGEIKRIAVPYLRNETSEPNIEIEITEQISDGLIKENTLKVVSDNEADAILEGSIIDYRNIPFTFKEDIASTQIQAEQYRLFIGLKVSLFNRKENTYIWENKQINVHGDYYLEETADQNYENALANVYRDIVEAILSSTVQDW
ncbi:MAG: LptE family protein [Candidatus Krumholzibacteriota bacterium]|nr:LptE family protein [Candidatus Krumholzibacteriota bacterium]